MRFETKTVHVGEDPDFRDGGSGDVVVPIHLSSTFARSKVDEPTAGYEYSRSGNPTRDALEARFAALENAKYGLAFSSGMAAEATLCFSVLKPGDHVVAFDDLYGGTRRLFDRVLAPNAGIEFTYVDARDCENIRCGLKENTKLVFLESPTNPIMRLCDMREASDIARERGIITAVDNTFMSPYFQNPLDLGADVVLHSTSKYMNGHSDSIGGAIMVNDEELFRAIKFNQNAVGAVLSPFDSYMVLRGTKTLAVRMRAHAENAQKIAEYLEPHPKIDCVHYPGLPSHPQHELAKSQMSGFGGMLSFEIAGGLEAARTFLENLEVFALAESLGGVESLIEHPALMTHASIPREEREKVGLGDGLVRISAGIEHPDDLIEDLESALAHVG
jgi:cystathionine gamma-lyase